MKNSIKKMLLRIAAVVVVACICSLSVAAMQIVINLPDGQLQIEVEPNDTIDSIKTKVQERCGITPDKQRVYYNGELLEEGKTLSDYDIGAGAELEIKLRGIGLDEVIGSATVEVGCTFVPGEQADTVYKVDLTWGSMEFTYTGASEGTWNPETHAFDGATEASWTHEEGANKICVTNHSNAAVQIGISATLNDGITYNFTDSADAQVSSVELGSAVGTEVSNAPTADIFFNITGGNVEQTGKIGVITISLS